MANFDFTETERHEIDNIYSKIANNETLTTDEALLYARFEAYKAVYDEELQAELKRKDEANKAAIEETRATAQAARDNFETLTALAIERYERTLNNGE